MGQQEEHLIDSSKKSSLEKTNVVCVCVCVYEDVSAAGFTQENREQNSTQN